MSDNVIEFLIKGNSSGAVRAFNDVGGAAGALTKTLGVLGVALTAVEMVEFIGHQIEVADQFGKMAQKTGVAVGALSELSFAFSLADVSTESLGTSLKFLNRSISEASKGNDQAIAAFNALGLSLNQIKSQSPDQTLLDMADAFSKSNDGAAKTAVAIQLLGRAGEQMIPGLNQGRAGIEELMRKARELGLTVDSEFAASAEKFNDSLKEMRAHTEGAGRTIAKALLPVLNETIEAFSELFKSTGEEGVIPWMKIMQYGVAAVAATFLSIVTVAKWVYEGVAGTFNAIGQALGSLLASLKLASEGEFKLAGQALVAGFDGAKEAIIKANAEMDRTWTAGNQGAEAIFNSLTKVKDKVSEVGTTAKKGKKDIELFDPALAKKQQDFLDALVKDTASATQNRIAILDSEYNHRVSQINQLHFKEADAVKARAELDKWYAQNRYEIESQMYEKLGADSELFYQRKQELVQRDIEQMQMAGVSQVEIDTFAKQQLRDLDIQHYQARQEQRLADLESTVLFSESTTEVVAASMEQWAIQMGSVNEQINGLVLNTMNSVIDGISTSVGRALAMGQSLSEALKSVFQSVLASIIAGLVKMGIQRLIFSALNITATATEASAQLASGLASTYVNSFSSAAAIPLYGWMIAPGAAATNLALATAGATAAMAAGKGIGAAAGVAHAGLTDVPFEGTFLLNKGERVLAPEQNKDLTEFLDDAGSAGAVTGGGSGGSVHVENLEINITVPNAEGLKAISEADWREIIASRIVPAAQVLERQGIRLGGFEKGRR